MTPKRILYVTAAVLFALAWLVALGTITSDNDLLGYQALLVLGLAVGYAGHAT